MKIKMVKVEIESDHQINPTHQKEDLGFAQAIELVAQADPIKQLRILEEIPKLSIR